MTKTDMNEPRRSAAITSLATLLALTALPASLAFRSAEDAATDATRALVDPELLKLGITDARQLSEVDLAPDAAFRWDFPRLDAARLEIGATMRFILPGGRTLDLPLVERSILSSNSLLFLFADHASAASAEIVVTSTGRASIATGRARCSTKAGPEEWLLTTGHDAQGIGGDYWSRSDISPVEIAAVATSAPANGGGEGGGEGGIAGGGCEDTGALIDLLIAYTPAMLGAAGGELDTLQAIVAADIALANQALSASNAIPRFRIAGYWAAPQNSTGDLQNDLLKLQDPVDSWNDGVHIARNEVAADLVMLYEGVGSGGGIGFLGIGGGEENGFSVNASAGGFGAAKLLGFNMGACTETTSAFPCTGYYDWSHAWLFTTDDGALRGTVMASEPTASLYPIYSNVYVEVGGATTGAPTNANEADAGIQANNTRTISLTARNVANFRCSSLGDQDCDNDGVLDAEAIANGDVPDCNATGFPDACDIAFGISQDANDDGVPDECPLTDTEISIAGAVQLDTFGTSVSLSQRTGDPEILLGMGAPGDDTGASNAGEAIVLEATAGAIDFTSQSFLRPHDPSINAFFGRSISVLRRPAFTGATNPLYNYPERKLAFVSAFRWQHNSSAGIFPSKGACYLYEQLPDGTWAQVQAPATGGTTTPWRITPPGSGGYGAGSYALFGYSTAIGHAPVEVAEMLVIGTPGYDEGKGAVYIYRNPSVTVGTWRKDQPTVTRRELITGGQAGDAFGTSVAVEDEIQTTGASRMAFIAGAPGRNEGRGYAILRERSVSTQGFSTTWPVTTGYVFDLSNPVGAGATLQPGDRYGSSVAIAGRIAVVGAPGAGGGKGRIYIWERNTGTSSSGSWSFRGFMTSEDPLVQQFGASVAVAKTADPNEYRIVVGATKADIAFGSTVKVDAGAVYIIRKTIGTAPGEIIERRLANTPASGDEFGYSAASVPGFSLIGAPFKDTGGLNAGSVKLLTVP